LPIQAAAVRALCEHNIVETCRAASDEKAAFGSVMPVLSVGVRF